MVDTSTCTAWGCRTVTPGLVQTCPTCGARTITSRRIRLLGWLLVVCGIILIGMMGFITLAMYPTLSRPGEDLGELGRFSGSAEQAQMVLNLFWMVIAIGVLSLVNGSWQIVTGRRNMLFVVTTLLAASVLVITTWETTEALQKGREAEEPRRIVEPPPMAPVNLEDPAPDKPR